MEQKYDTILFDLGNTLVSYYTRDEFPAILNQSITKVAECLKQHSLLNISLESALTTAPKENYEAKDLVVRPLLSRLCHIFNLDVLHISTSLDLELSRCFLKPVFDIARIYDDVIPVLTHLRSAGYRCAIISNTPWGTPASLWREELSRWRLDDLVDTAVFCEEVGMRKPAKEIFEYTLCKLERSPDKCVFIGDDPRWDIVGPQRIGIETVLIERNDVLQSSLIRNLYELLDYLSIPRQELK
ncbi:MAG: HAD family hydrolase [Armatimonadota bacterium]